MKEFIEKLIGRLEEASRTMMPVIPTEEAINIVNQLAEEYKGEELRKSQKIYSFIKREINPYGKPFEGTVYEFGLKVMKYIKNIHTEELAEEYKHCIKSSCSNCEVYDKEKHYCPKWCEVIKGTVAEIEENRWIACSERLPEKGKAVLTCTKDGWISVNINMSYNGKKNDFECGYYTAWMPLPQAYKPKGE